MSDEHEDPNLNAHSESVDGTKRKMEEDIQLAKQKAQEIAARLVGSAESKRPRLDDSSELAPLSSSASIPSFPVSFASQTAQYHGLQGTSKRISIPNGKVGVIIGKGGETIKYLQLQSGAKIQITKDAEADPYSLTRDVELMGTSEQISRAEQLIKDVIAETDTGASAPSPNQGLNIMQPGAEQFSMKVPNTKVALLIGKGGETIRTMQSKSGARIQIIPLHLPPGDTSTERTVYINGLTEQIDSAKELINDVINGKRIVNPSGANSYMQPAYPPPSWAPPVQPLMQQQQQQPPQYGYPYNTTSAYYGNYPTAQVAGWDHSNQSMSQPSQQSTGYGYYAQQGHVGSAPPNPSYSYGQTPQATNYGYDQGYSQQPPQYGQNLSSQPLPIEQQKQSGYGPPAVSPQPNGTPSQTTHPSSTYPPAYSQPVADPQAGYWAYPSSTGQTPAQTGYDQSGYSQTGFEAQQGVQAPPLSTQPVYGQGGYPQPAPAPVNYDHGTNPPAYYGQPQTQSQLPTNGFVQPSVSGAERNVDGNSDAGNGSNLDVQETVGSQS